MMETIKSIMDWQEQAFPEATISGQVAKYQEEQMEFLNTFYTKETDITELADMFIVACGIARFSAMYGLRFFGDVYRWLEQTEFTDVELEKAINKKMKINRKREWTSAGGKYKHVSK